MALFAGYSVYGALMIVVDVKQGVDIFSRNFHRSLMP